jgi:hypothetical protein
MVSTWHTRSGMAEWAISAVDCAENAGVVTSRWRDGRYANNWLLFVDSKNKCDVIALR